MILFITLATIKFGNITVDTIKGEIKFDATVNKKKGWVQFLIYLDGYKWLKENCAIISEAKLSDLQKAIAILDWKLWDDIWFRKRKIQELSVLVEWNNKKIDAKELIKSKDTVDISDIIFCGSPYFDYIVLEGAPIINCFACPLLELEKKLIKEEFGAGYRLNSNIPVGRKVKIIIKKFD